MPLQSFALTEGHEIVENDVLSIEDCVNVALTNSPAVKKAQQTLLAAKARVGMAKSDYFPKLNAKTGYGYNGDFIHSSNTNSYAANVGLSQLIYNFGKTGANINMRKFQVLSSEADLNNEVLKTIFDVREKYYGVLAAKANIDVQEAYVQVNERQYIRTKAYFEEGLKSKIDLVNAEFNLSKSNIDLINSKNTYETSLISLNNAMYVIGVPNYSIQSTESFNFKSKSVEVSTDNISKSDEIYELPKLDEGQVFTTSVVKTDILKDYIFKPFPYTFNEVIDMANKNRPDLKALRATCSALEQALKFAKRQYAPSIDANVDYGYKALSVSPSTNSGLTAGAYLNFPVVNAMNIKYAIKEAQANLDVAKETLSKNEKDVYFAVQKAYINMTKLERQIPLQQIKVRQALENAELADGRYMVGLADFIELQDANVKYNQAQQEYVKMVFDYNVARAKLELAIALVPEEIKQVEGINNNANK